METQLHHEIAMTNEATTIDASVVQSRILQSSSLARAAAAQDSDDEMGGDGTAQPVFPKLDAMADRGGKVEYRRVRCPKHRYTPLRNDWEQILMPLVQFLKLQVSTTPKHEHTTKRKIWREFLLTLLLLGKFHRFASTQKRDL